MLTQEELLFLIIWIVNFVITLLYFLWGTQILVPIWNTWRKQESQEERKEPQESRVTWGIRCAVMILCPIVGPLFFLCSHVVYRTIFRQHVDLEDVIFSKERVKTHLKADEERERNMVPLEEALAVSDKKNLRMLMMNVIRGDLQESLESIMLALNSEDSETSHYAASVLRDELNNFRTNVQRLQQEVKNESQEEAEYEEMLIDYMKGILRQRIFTDIEQENFVKLLDETAQSLYEKNRAGMTRQRYESVCIQLMEEREFEKAEIWCKRLKEQYPGELVSYTCELKLYFKMNDKEKFFAVMEELKQSDTVIDSEILEVLRIFSLS